MNEQIPNRNMIKQQLSGNGSSSPTHATLPSWVQSLISARRPGYSLPQPFYNHSDIHDIDIELIWKRFWLFVGHTSQVPNPGDYFLYNVGKEPVIILRDESGRVNALMNVCRHRGSLVCNTERGHTKKLVCPYHQWVYNLDGSLQAARLMPEDFDKSEFGLFNLPCRVLEGFIFISLAENPPDFDKLERIYKPHMKMYDIPHTKIAFSARYQVGANWKLIAENFRECYHCGGGHPEYCTVIVGANLLQNRQKAMKVKQQKLREWEAMGIPVYRQVFDSEEIWYYCERYPYEPGFITESLDGTAVAPMLGSLEHRDVGVWSIVQYPNFWLDINNDYAWTMRVTPISATMSEVEAAWLVREDAVEGKDYDVEKLIAFWKTTAEQDWKLCEDNQSGVNSSFYRPGPYSDGEGGPDQFVEWYLYELNKAGK